MGNPADLILIPSGVLSRKPHLNASRRWWEYVTKTIMDYIAEKHPDLMPLYDEIYNKKDRSYFEALEKKAEEIAEKYGCRFVDNETPYERVPQGHPTIVDYFYHEEVRGTANSGKRIKKQK